MVNENIQKNKCIIEFDDVSVGYNKKNCIVKNFSTQILMGDFVSIIGPNGSGKSTILKALFNLVTINSGSIKLNNKNIKSYKKKELAKNISFVPQITNFPSDVTVYEFVMMGRYPYGNAINSDKINDKKIVLESIEKVGLSGFEHHYINNLSGGQQQRALIALSLAQDTEIIVLDEPTNHLDIKMQLEVMKILEQLNKQSLKTIIMVVHDINHGLKFSNKVIVMKNGFKVSEGKICETINNNLIKQVFDVNSELTTSINKTIIKDYWL